MATLKRDYSIRLGNYIQLTEPQTLEDVLNQFVGEPNNAITRQRVIFALHEWNMRNLSLIHI